MEQKYGIIILLFIAKTIYQLSSMEMVIKNGILMMSFIGIIIYQLLLEKMVLNVGGGAVWNIEMEIILLLSGLTVMKNGGD